MSETGGLDIGMPDEGGGSASEEVREQAAQGFAASQAAAAAQAREEKKSRKRDDGVAQVILQFLNDKQKTHLATLIARLVARDCPTVFLLAVLSLINEKCAAAVSDYLKERNIEAPSPDNFDHSIIPVNKALTEGANEQLAAWVMRMDMVMQTDGDNILNSLLVDDQNIDGTILQLVSFVLQEFLALQEKAVEFENLQQLSAGILQPLFAPYMQLRMERRLAEAKDDEDDD